MIPLRDAVAMFMRHREVKNLSPSTLRLYRRRLLFWLIWRERQSLEPSLVGVTADEMRLYLRYLLLEHVPHAENPHRPPATGHMAVASVQSDWRILRALWTFLADEELLSDGQRKFFLKGRVPCPKENEEELRPVCPPETLDALLAACASDDPEEEWRNRAILLLLTETGMRVSELCGPLGLRDKDVSLAKRWATVRGKGGRRRWVYWSEDAGYALALYLRHRRGRWGGTLPLIRGMSSRNNGLAFTADAARSMVRRLAEKAGVELVAKAPLHSLRHAFAHDGLDEGIDGLHLQQLLGHRSAATTARYTREHPRRLRQVYDRFYRRRRRSSYQR